MRTTLRTIAATLAAASCLLPLAARAQVAPAAPKTAPKPASSVVDDTVVISPFVVSTEKDTGYIAADTLNAGRLSTNLLMTPGNFDVFTRDFINDLGIYNIDEASAWLTNGRPLELGAIEGNSLNPGSLALNDSGTNVSLRGLGANPSTRNYFTSGATPKEYNVERVESSRGPNAILYGEGGPGGAVNYITKRAQHRNFNTLRLRTDDMLSKGAALDLNRKLTNKLDARYNLNLLDKHYFLDRTSFSEVDHALNLIYRPFERSAITVDVDLTRNSRPGLIMAYAEQYAKWDHLPVTGKLTGTITQKGLVNWTGAKNLIWVEGQGMMDYTGYAHTAGYGLPQPIESTYGDSYFPSATTGAPGISSLGLLPRAFNANPKDIDVNDKSQDYQLSFDHTFKNNISVQIAGQASRFNTKGGNYYFTTIYLDALRTLPNGANNPNYGKPYANSYVGRTVNYERDSKSLRLVASYPLHAFGGVTSFSAFLLSQQKNDTTVYTDLHIKDPTSTLSITDAASQIHVNRYFDDLTESLPDFRKLYDTADVPVIDGRNHQKIQAVEVAASGNYLHDTLSIIAGFRRDKSQLSSENGNVATRDTKTGKFVDYTTDSRTGFNNTTTTGFVYFPEKYVGIYGNVGEGFIIQTISNKRLDGSFSKANIVPSKEKDAGLRFQFAGSGFKIVGSVGYYRAEQKNAARSLGVGNINTLWRDQGLFDGKSYTNKYIETFSGDPFSTAATNSITSSASTIGTGYEASLTANVGNAFRLTLNGALPKTKQSDVSADYLAYVNQNFPAWQALAANPANSNRANDTTLVNQITQTITGFQEGRAQNLTYNYRYNVFGIYTLQGPMLKGLRFGGGVQFYGKSIIGNAINQPFNYVYAGTYHLVSGQLGYTFKFGKQRIDAQLNVDNLLNYNQPIYNGLFVYTVNGQSYNIPYGTKSVWPRSARLSLSIPF